MAVIIGTRFARFAHSLAGRTAPHLHKESDATMHREAGLVSERAEGFSVMHSGSKMQPGPAELKRNRYSLVIVRKGVALPNLVASC